MEAHGHLAGPTTGSNIKVSQCMEPSWNQTQKCGATPCLRSQEYAWRHCTSDPLLLPKLQSLLVGPSTVVCNCFAVAPMMERTLV